jgi:hypothetical protein
VPDATDATAEPSAVKFRVVEVVDCAAPTVTRREVVAAMDPEVPVMTTVPVSEGVLPFAVSVNVLLVVAGLGEKEAVTPLGRPLAARLKLPANPFWGMIVSVDLAELPALRLISFGAAASVKFGELIVRVTSVDAVRVPEVPVIVTDAVPGVARLLTASVNTVVPEVGFGEKDAVTPLGKPDAT